MSTPTELVQVNFHGDTLEAIQEEGAVWVSLKRCCLNLGLSYSKQLAKLKKKGWARVSLRAMRDSIGRTQDVAVVDVETLSGWLFSVEERNVREEVREPLRRYQKEAAKAIAAHFFGGPAPAPAPTTGDPILDTLRSVGAALAAIGDMRERQLVVEREQAEIRRLAAAAQATATAALDQARNNHGKMQLIGWARLLGMELSESQAAAHGRALAQLCRERGIEVERQAHQRYGAVNLYPTSVLREYMGEPEGWAGAT